MAQILLVEDDPNIQSWLAEALKAQGHTVVIERDGSHAVDSFTRAPTEAIILDVMLPGLNGFQVAERIRSLPAGVRVPIVMMSGIYRGQTHSKTAVNRLGVIAYVEKPFQLDHVLTPLRAALTGGVAPTAASSDAPRPPPRQLAPGEQGAARVAVRGRIRDRALVWVFAEIARRRANGVLVLSTGDALTCIWFHEGAVAYARRRGAAHRLGSVLARDRAVTDLEWAEVVRRGRSTGKRLGDIAVDVGCLSIEALRAVEERRAEAALLDVFGWPDGEFQFVLRGRLPRGFPAVQLPPSLALLHRCVRDGMSDVEVGRELSARFGERPALAGADALRTARSQLPEADALALAQLDGVRTIREIVTERIVSDIGPLLLSAMATGLVLPASALRATAAHPTVPLPSIPLTASAPRPPAPPPSPPRPPNPPSPPVAGSSRASHVETQPLQNKLREVVPITRSIRSLDDGGAAPSSAPRAKPAPTTRAPPPPAPPAPPEPKRDPPESPADAKGQDDPAKVAELRARVEAMAQQDHFGVLGVSRTTGAVDVRTAYHALAKAFHPDRHAYAGPTARDLADAIFSRLSEANKVLGDAALRAKYEEQLKTKPGDADASEKLARIVGAEKAFRMGEMEMKRRGYAAAVRHFEEAVRLFDEEGEYHAWLAHALSLAMPNDSTVKRRLQSLLSVAKQKNPNCAKAFLFQGMIHKTSGRMSEAEAEFRQALEINDKEVDAARELRLIAMRREKGKKS